jgi:hypothetical protein
LRIGAYLVVLLALCGAGKPLALLTTEAVIGVFPLVPGELRELLAAHRLTHGAAPAHATANDVAYQKHLDALASINLGTNLSVRAALVNQATPFQRPLRIPTRFLKRVGGGGSAEGGQLPP